MEERDAGEDSVWNLSASVPSVAGARLKRQENYRITLNKGSGSAPEFGFRLLKCDASCVSQIYACSLRIKHLTKLRPLTHAALFGKSLRANK